MANWLGIQPDAVLNAKDCTFDTGKLHPSYRPTSRTQPLTVSLQPTMHVAQFKYTVGHPEITSNDMIDILIKRELTRTTGQLNDEIFEEVEDSLAGMFGDDGAWRTLGVFDSMTRTVGRAANRIFVGKELCEYFSGR